MKFLEKNWLYVLLFVVLLTIIIYLVFRKKSTIIKPPSQVDVIDPATNNIVTFQPAPYTDALWYEMDRNSFWSGRNLKPYEDLISLSDGQFKAVNNDWNLRIFSKADNKTLAQRILEEKSWYISGDQEDNEKFPALKQSILNRTKTLGLS